MFAKTFYFLPIFLCIGFTSLSQSVKVNEVYDDLVGIGNLGLYNGPEFKDTFPYRENDHRYLDYYDFTKGSIVYNNQLYSNVLLKYDLFEDNVITRSNDDLGIFKIRLIPENILRFTVYDRDFVRLDNADLGVQDNGFFEVAYLGNNIDFYIKHVKKKKEETINYVVRYSFMKANYYLLWYENAYYKIHSIKDLIKAIPERSKQIRDFQKNNRSMFKMDLDSFMKRLVKHIDVLYSSN